MYIDVKIGQLDSFVIHQRVMAQNYARKCSVLGFTSRHFAINYPNCFRQKTVQKTLNKCHYNDQKICLTF